MLTRTTRIEHVDSYYAATGLQQPPRPVLQGSHEADVCIIGAGYTGLNAALHLAQKGYKVIILEAARVGWGASGRNGGQIVHSYSRDIDVVQARYGDDVARPLAAMAFEGARVLRENVAQHGIDCQLKDGGVFAAITARQAAQLRHHQALWQAHGHPGLEIVEGAAMRNIVASDRYRALLVDPTGGHFHPLRLAQGEALAFEAQRGRIFEQSAVTRIERSDPAVIHTVEGQVRARFAIVACNAYIGELEPSLLGRSMPCGTQVVATEPLGALARELLPQDHCVEDCNFMLDYFRLSAEGRLLYGGGVIYGARDPAHIESIIRPKMLKTFPQDLHAPDRPRAGPGHPGPDRTLRRLRPAAAPALPWRPRAARALHGTGRLVLRPARRARGVSERGARRRTPSFTQAGAAVRAGFRPVGGAGAGSRTRPHAAGPAQSRAHHRRSLQRAPHRR